MKIGTIVTNGSNVARVTGFKRVFGRDAVRVEWTAEVPIKDHVSGRVDVVPCLRHDTWFVSDLSSVTQEVEG